MTTLDKSLEDTPFHFLIQKVEMRASDKIELIKLMNEVIQAERQRCEELVNGCIEEVNYYRTTPRVRRDFCKWCDEILLPKYICDCKIETVRKELLELITMDLQAINQPNNIK